MHEILHDIRSLERSPARIRSFALVVGGVLLAIALLLFWRRAWTLTPLVTTLAGAGLLLLLAGTVRPALLGPVYIAWMAVAVVLGFVMTRVLLAIVFYLVLTPIALIMRLTGHDPLRRKAPPSESYWIEKEYRDASRHRLEKYF